MCTFLSVLRLIVIVLLKKISDGKVMNVYYLFRTSILRTIRQNLPQLARRSFLDDRQ